ncbi:hypothetical protein O181_024972 [Austropuccinia psidii MF-1]|uniref:Uncharacterized protein n=1 Tax=Austropuccinia psidii MF-1 TaxID=1389203 RepID=A0A9Q3CKA3_9BASI|nr:hypothetical protein [Austropuccinia psidii MF-1]
MKGASPSKRGGVMSRQSRSFSGLLGDYLSIFQGPRSRLGEAKYEEGESVEEEECGETEVAPALAGAPEASETPDLSLSNQPLVSQAEPTFLKMKEQMTQFMGQLTQSVAPRENLRAPEFKSPSMKESDSFDGSQAHNLRELFNTVN